MSIALPRRRLCRRCARPESACLCAWATTVDNPTTVCVLQHPDEVGHAKGTLTLLQLSLSNCRVHVGEAFEPEVLGAPWPEAQAHWALLYPPEPGPGKGAAGVWPATHPLRGLVVLDGTWRKTLRLLRRNPWLAALPRLGLDLARPSAYRIRRARHGHQLSTLEATAHALGQIEAAPQRYEALLQGLEGFVAAAAQRRPQRMAFTDPEPATVDLTCGGLPE